VSTRLFFALAFAITWTVQLPAVLAALGLVAGPLEQYMPLAGLGAFGPLIAAVIVARRSPGGAKGLFARLRIRGVGPMWYVVALLLPAALLAAGMAVYSLVGGSGPWVWPPADGQRIAAMIVFPLGEEFGWRGLALPRLQARYGPLAASGILGALWGLWHIPMFVLAGVSAVPFVFGMATVIAGSFMFTWLFNHTRGSLLLAILLHVGVHLSNPNQALPADVMPLVVYTAALVVFAIAVVVLDPRAWRRDVAVS